MSAAKSRREIGARLGLGAAAFVTSIVEPIPAQAASCRTQGQSCVPDFIPGPHWLPRLGVRGLPYFHYFASAPRRGALTRMARIISILASADKRKAADWTKVPCCGAPPELCQGRCEVGGQ